MIKIILATMISLGITSSTLACELCKSQQPKVLRELAHGMGPQGAVDYLIVWTGVAVVILALITTLYFLLFPSKADAYFQIKNMNFEAKSNL